MKRYPFLAAIVGTLVLSACNANGISQVTPPSQVPLSSIGKLQFAVGTMNVGFDGNKIGLNTVETFRQSNGDSATLVNTPVITGPSGFTDTAGSTPPNVTPQCQYGVFTAGGDAGTNHISGNPQNPNPVSTPLPLTFGQSGGVFSYGIQPLNETEGAPAYYAGAIDNEACGTYKLGFTTPNYPAYPEPFYSQANIFPSAVAGASGPPVYLGGPPAYPFFNDGTYPSGFAGYLQGFTAFEVTPVAGSYTLKVNIQAANASSASYSATASLNNTTPLPNLSAPTFTSDGKGGGSGTITVPSDPRIVETMVYIYDTQQSTYYTVGPLKGTGTLTYTVPDTLGPCSGSGCQTSSSTSRPTLLSSGGTGNTVDVYAASFDYHMFEASPPGNKSQAPAITGAGGQADITLSPLTYATE
ncbi:MAG TPA: hypothetical protein VKT72_16215 [Candidatus Baltobacteraceae bacterium]|nr:hypothetical protein [Candidatus Baltobacteraceae bacterium]